MARKPTLEEIMGAGAKNGNWTHNSKGLPNPLQMFDYASQAVSQQIGNEFKDAKLEALDMFDGTYDGFMTWSGIFYRMFVNFMGGLWKYNKAMLKALGLDGYEIDRKLFEAGKLAFIKDANGKIFLLPFEVVDKNVYEKPTKIRIVNSNDHFNGNEYDQFVVIKNDPNEWNKIVENAPYLVLTYKILCELHDNLTQAQNHYLILSDGSWAVNEAQNDQELHDFSLGRLKFKTYTPKNIDEEHNPVDPNGKTEDVFDKFQKSVVKLEFVDKIDTLTNAYYNYLQEALKYLGFSVNMNEKKKERQITGEIDIQQEIPESQRKAMFRCRKTAIEQVNEVFELSDPWDIEMDDENTINTGVSNEEATEERGDENE